MKMCQDDENKGHLTELTLQRETGLIMDSVCVLLTLR